ncbi:hypothetical protein LguiA_033955 [Lonicera macranthoides]
MGIWFKKMIQMTRLKVLLRVPSKEAVAVGPTALMSKKERTKLGQAYEVLDDVKLPSKTEIRRARARHVGISLKAKWPTWI